MWLGKSRPSGTKYNLRLILIVSASLLVLASMWVGSANTANALLLTPQDHWKYNVEWVWKPSLRKTAGIIDSRIIIENETADKIVGYIADENGTRLWMYGDDQVVRVKYLYDSGFSSDWEIAGKFTDGFFTIDVPQQYKDAETIGIYIGSNSYRVDLPGVYPQPLVLINPARMDYRTNSELDVAQVNAENEGENNSAPTEVANAKASLIDWILQQFLQQFSLLPVGRSNSGK